MNSVNFNKRKTSEYSIKSLLLPSQNDLQDSYAPAAKSLQHSVLETSPKSPRKSPTSPLQSFDCSSQSILYTKSGKGNERFSGIADLNDEQQSVVQKIKHLVEEKDPDIFSKFSKGVKDLLF